MDSVVRRLARPALLIHQSVYLSHEQPRAATKIQKQCKPHTPRLPLTNLFRRALHMHRIKDSTVAPSHLDGTLPGDFGFDPLGLGVDPARLKYYQEAELMNARWAMMAVAGISATDVLGIGVRAPPRSRPGASTTCVRYAFLSAAELSVSACSPRRVRWLLCSRDEHSLYAAPPIGFRASTKRERTERLTSGITFTPAKPPLP